MQTNNQAMTWVLTGPTASGKSGLAMQLAELCDLEILSMDSMAVYRRMDIGTAKPSAAQRQQVPHHCLDLVGPNQGFDTSSYCAAAQEALDQVQARGKQALFVGGTPLYLMAFFKGMLEGPSAAPELRQRLQEEEAQDPGRLHRRLQDIDPKAAELIHPNDQKRLVRALEVWELTGKPISAQRTQFDAPGFRLPCRILGVQWEREALHQRVKTRTVQMLEQGLLDEVREIRDSCGFSPQAAAGIGYAEGLRQLDGGYKDLEECRNMIRRASHRLIRRQTTWLRRLPELQWISPQIQPASLLETFRSAPMTG